MNKSIILYSLLSVVLFFLPSINMAQTTDANNYVMEWTVKTPETNEAVIPTLPAEKARLSTAFFDGIGRPSQQVLRQGSLATGNTATDLVSFHVYDVNGREPDVYLPFAANTQGGNTSVNDGGFKTALATQQNYFMQQMYNTQGESHFYSKTIFEPSPLNRVVKTMAAGFNWNGASRGVEQQLYFNTAIDAVRKFSVNENGVGQFGTYSSPNTYNAQELYKMISVDEHGKQVIEFKDKEGKVILKKVQIGNTTDNGSGTAVNSNWLSTYYIYDVLNQLRAVIQPVGVLALENNGYTFTSNILDEQFFRYEYDEWGQMIVKKVPGKGYENMVYDARNRLVMTQDAVQRSAFPAEWFYTMYDDLNRPVKTGKFAAVTSAASFRSSARAAINFLQTYFNLQDISPEILTETYYDTYNFPGGPFVAAGYDNSYDSYLQSAGAWPHPQANSKSNATVGRVTGTKTKILGTASDYLYTAIIYDADGRIIQVKSSNILGGTDIITNQYSWAGKVLATVQKHQVTGTNAQTHVVASSYTLDKLERIVDIKKTVSSNVNGVSVNKAQQSIAEMVYDELGQLKNKKLAPAFNSGSGLENLAYDYNVRGWMLGMNRNYAKDAVTSNYFGFDLGYDKTANGLINNQSYQAPQYNGNISGSVWKSRGDGEKRRFDFNYDNANRLLGADFKQYSSGNFVNHSEINFDVKMGDGADPSKAYDANGNILEMQQWGLKLSNSSLIDHLRYTYYEGTNRLKSVKDFNNDVYSLLGDFKTSEFHPQQTAKDALNTSSSSGAFAAITDYTYDVNGNLAQDFNKQLTDGSGSGIRYNHLNLPVYIEKMDYIAYGHQTITYIYDATGNKLQKRVFIPLGRIGNDEVITTYVGAAVYEQRLRNGNESHSESKPNQLQLIGHEEGRIRFKPDDGINIASFQYDYFVKDHLGNVRAVLTEELQPAAIYKASMELDKREFELALFSNVYETEADKPTSPSPGFDSDGTNAKVSRLYNVAGTDKRMGPALLLKVMAGDKINARVFGWYAATGMDNTVYTGNPNLINSIINMLGGGLMNAGVKGSYSELLNPSGVLNIPVTSFLNDPDRPYTNTRPKAYLNWVMLDEQQLKYVDINSNSGAVQIPAISNTDQKQVLQANGGNDITIAKNGYIYVYVSNESQGEVFFDELKVEHTAGQLLEESHYYPFGLVMAGISSKAAGSLKNRKGYNGNELQSNEFSDDSGLEFYDFNARTYYQQIGRFIQIDPLTDEGEQERLSPYHFSYNNPIRYNDPDGKCPKCIEALVEKIVAKRKELLQGISVWAGSLLVKNDNVRKGYNNEKAGLKGKTDAASILKRDEIREKWRSKTPEPIKTALDQGRPPEQETFRPKNDAGKGNKTADNIAKTGGYLGKGMLLYSTYQSADAIANSFTPVTTAVSEGAGWAAAAYVGGNFATAGTAAGGPITGAISGIVGGAIGYTLGAEAGEALMNAKPIIEASLGEYRNQYPIDKPGNLIFHVR